MKDDLMFLSVRKREVWLKVNFLPSGRVEFEIGHDHTSLAARITLSPEDAETLAHSLEPELPRE